MQFFCTIPFTGAKVDSQWKSIAMDCVYPLFIVILSILQVFHRGTLNSFSFIVCIYVLSELPAPRTKLLLKFQREKLSSNSQICLLFASRGQCVSSSGFSSSCGRVLCACARNTLALKSGCNQRLTCRKKKGELKK